MHYLEGPFDSALGKIVQYLVPEHSYKSVHDFFNPQLFHAALIAILHDVPDLAAPLDSLLLAASLQGSQDSCTGAGFVEMRVRNFSLLWQAMATALSFQGQELREMAKEDLFRMVRDYGLDQLEILLEHLFELLIQHHGMVEYITQLPAEDQTAIKDFLQKAKKAKDNRNEIAHKQPEQDQQQKLEEENMELRQLLDSKEADLQRASFEKMELEDQLQEERDLQLAKEAEIEALKKRLMAYEETETLFQEKDEEIHKLNKAVTELQLSNRLLTSDLASDKSKLEARIAQLEHTSTELQTRLDKATVSLETTSKQKEEVEQSNKKVIANLKEKIKGQTDRMGEVQNQLVEARIGRELREREFGDLWANYEALRCQSLNQSKIGPEKVLFSSGDMDRGGLTSSGPQRQFMRLGEEITELEKFEENAFEEEIMMFEGGEDNLKKVQEIITENTRLKERLGALDSKDYRAVVQENDKLKKRLGVMRKRNEEIDSQRREELDLMVSTFEHCLRGRLEP